MHSETLSDPDLLRLNINSLLDSSTDEQKADFLKQVNESGNAPGIVAELARIIKEKATLSRIGDVSDIVGTGGDSKNTINVSTAAALVVSSMGVRIAKHGNFGATSNKGSADFLKSLGYNFDMDQESLRRRIRETSFAFILAPRYNDSFAKFAKARKMIPNKTAFNYLGPLTNPADPDVLMLGVTGKEIADLYTSYLILNRKKGCVLYSEDGMDEVSPYSRTLVTFVENGETESVMFEPAEIMGEKIGIEYISSLEPERSFELTRKGLAGTDLNAARFIALNAGLSLYINGKFSNVAEAYSNALEAIKSGMVEEHLAEIIEVSSNA